MKRAKSSVRRLGKRGSRTRCGLRANTSIARRGYITTGTGTAIPRRDDSYRRTGLGWPVGSTSTSTRRTRRRGPIRRVCKRNHRFHRIYRSRSKRVMYWVSPSMTIELNKVSPPRASVIGTMQCSTQMRLGARVAPYLGARMYGTTISRRLLVLASTEALKLQCAFTKTLEEKCMDIPKAQRPHDSHFDWEGFSRSVIESYGSFESPDYSFVKENLAATKYPGVIQFLEKNFYFYEDTEPNTDVSHGYFVRGDGADFILRISFVGPYYYLSSLSADGSQGSPSIDLPSTNSVYPLIKNMEEAGMIFTPVEVLNKKFNFGNQFSSVYSILYCYEDEPSWIEM